MMDFICLTYPCQPVVNIKKEQPHAGRTSISGVILMLKWRHITHLSEFRIFCKAFSCFPMLNALLSGWWASLVMSMGDTRADFSIRPPHSWWILIIFDPMIRVCSKQIDEFINLTKRIRISPNFDWDGNALLLPLLSWPGVTCHVLGVHWLNYMTLYTGTHAHSRQMTPYKLVDFYCMYYIYISLLKIIAEWYTCVNSHGFIFNTYQN